MLPSSAPPPRWVGVFSCPDVVTPGLSRQDCHALVEMNKKAVTYAKSGKSLRKEKSSKKNFFFWLCCLAYGILIPQQGIETATPLVEAES